MSETAESAQILNNNKLFKEIRDTVSKVIERIPVERFNYLPEEIAKEIVSQLTIDRKEVKDVLDAALFHASPYTINTEKIAEKICQAKNIILLKKEESIN